MTIALPFLLVAVVCSLGPVSAHLGGLGSDKLPVVDDLIKHATPLPERFVSWLAKILHCRLELKNLSEANAGITNLLEEMQDHPNNVVNGVEKPEADPVKALRQIPELEPAVSPEGSLI
ncbi:hypothetical protein NDU88_011467 [Pleurodeles waltl]|uniref:Uncharacterized protein n=1 Tax=Pleurodeles waltl TaxID=8319 RepID=A0AAV7PYS8_PLEWA|nr:hypothetical protein NDU88_011467 [Pleurodeles waltl]